jgi:glycosyltransferase involved in cell wall biosynthesis
MRVALFSYEYPPETGFGGIGTYTQNLARDLVSAGATVHVIAGAAVAKKTTSVEEGVHVTRFKYGRPYRKVYDWLWNHEFPSASRRFETALSMYRCFRDIHARHPFDVVEAPDCGAEGAFVYSRVRGIKKVITFHSPMYLIGGYYDNNAIDLSVTCFLEKMAVKNADAYITLSRALATRVKEDFHINKPVTVVPLGLDMERLSAVPHVDIRKKYRIPAGARVVLVLGRVERRKGTDLLQSVIPEVVRAVPQSFFLIVGRVLYPAIKKEIEARLKACNCADRAMFTGHVGFEDMVNSIRSCDVFLLPSRWENFPRTLLEAMGAGKAIVAASVGGVPEMIEDKVSGLLGRLGCPGSLARGIITLLEDPQSAKRYGEEALKRARRRFDHKLITKRIIEVYTS